MEKKQENKEVKHDDMTDLYDEIWKHYDKNQDGHLSIKEIKRLMKDILHEKNVKTSQVKQLIADLDQNNDGMLSKKEFTNLIEKMIPPKSETS